MILLSVKGYNELIKTTNKKKLTFSKVSLKK